MLCTFILWKKSARSCIHFSLFSQIVPVKRPWKVQLVCWEKRDGISSGRHHLPIVDIIEVEFRLIVTEVFVKGQWNLYQLSDGPKYVCGQWAERFRSYLFINHNASAIPQLGPHLHASEHQLSSCTLWYGSCYLSFIGLTATAGRYDDAPAASSL